MKTKRIFVVLITTLLCTQFIQCKKEVAGPAGTDGKDGNANVVSSTIVINPSGWYVAGTQYRADITYSAITSGIVSTGAVLVYIGNGTSYEQLPLTIYPASTYSETRDFFYYNGGLSLLSYDSDLTLPLAPPSSASYKIVVIASSSLIQHPNVDFKNYDEVCRIFNLK